MDQKVWLICSQKGGVSKSAIAYSLSQRLALSDYNTILCDTDYGQHTPAMWIEIRIEQGGTPMPFALKRCDNPERVRKFMRGYSQVVIDCPPHASQDTYDYARMASVVVLPTRTALADMVPNLDLARDLEARGIPRERMVFVITQSPSKAETRSAQKTLRNEGWAVLEQDLHFAGSFTTCGDTGKSVAEVAHRGLRYKVEQLLDQLTER